MLYLSRKIGESIVINDEVEITLVEIRGKTAKLGFDSPSEVSILRKELHEKLALQNREAAQAALDSAALDALSGLMTEASAPPAPQSSPSPADRDD